MENVLNITQIDRITTKDLVVLRVAGNPTPVIRNGKQFIQDLKNSYLIDEDVANLKHPQVTRALRQLKRSTVYGDIAFNKKGEEWTVTKDSSVITNSSHPSYGKVAIGDKMTYTADQFRVEGFLTLEMNAKAEFNRDKADAYAQAEMASSGAFAFAAAPATEEPTPDLPAEMDNGAVTEAFGEGE